MFALRHEQNFFLTLAHHIKLWLALCVWNPCVYVRFWARWVTQALDKGHIVDDDQQVCTCNGSYGTMRVFCILIVPYNFPTTGHSWMMNLRFHIGTCWIYLCVIFSRNHSLTLKPTSSFLETSIILFLNHGPEEFRRLFFHALPEHGEELHGILHPPHSDVSFHVVWAHMY